ncbi:hypothetical protein KCP73_11130 [Salmonella enterica subsp. enterica]|nr:hypothetical protein KCP73_11130 [Salmonella enterica subsp. enterica]
MLKAFIKITGSDGAAGNESVLFVFRGALDSQYFERASSGNEFPVARKFCAVGDWRDDGNAHPQY